MKSEYAMILDQLTSLRRFRKRILDEINASLKDISSMDFYILHKICSGEEGRTMSDLSNSTGLSNGFITLSIDNLEEKKLVARKRGLDRRSYVIELTPKGKERCMEIERIKNSSLEKVFRNMSKEDLSELRDALKKLNDIIEGLMV